MPPSNSPIPASERLLANTGELAQEMIAFLRDIVAIPSPSGDEEAVVRRVQEEMLKIGFDEIKIDPFGNVLGRMGKGPIVIAFDAHLDTVGIGDSDQWSCDPYQGKVVDGCVYGRGAVDQKAGMAAMVYAGKLMKDLALIDNCQVWMVGSVQEEDCDGLSWHYILEENVLKPEVVISTEPTNLKIHRGQRGRMNIFVSTSGRSCHGSMPHLGENAVTKLAPAFGAIEGLNSRITVDPFLGQGSCCVTWIGSKSPSLNAVPHEASLHIDRRLTTGESRESALAEIREVLRTAGVQATVHVPVYEQPSWTGLVYPLDQYYPTWTVPSDHPTVRAGVAAARDLFGQEPEISRWNFSTNGVMINGRHKVPCLGFGPGQEELAHTRDEHVPISEVVQACAFYAAYPSVYCRALE